MQLASEELEEKWRFQLCVLLRLLEPARVNRISNGNVSNAGYSLICRFVEELLELNKSTFVCTEKDTFSFLLHWFTFASSSSLLMGCGLAEGIFTHSLALSLRARGGV